MMWATLDELIREREIVLGRSMRALATALATAMIIALLPSTAVLAGGGPGAPPSELLLAETEPTSSPSPDPTPAPTPAPTPDPTPAPTPDPTPAPTPDPTPAPTPDPTLVPDATATPGPTATPDLAAESDTPAATPEPTPAPTATPEPVPAITIERPTAGSTIPVRANDTPTISWTEDPALRVRGRTVIEEAGAADLNGDCAYAVTAVTWTREDAASPLAVSGLTAGWCYRYTVELSLQGGESASATSGWYRVLTPWTGTVNLYRSGVFSTQRRSSWCVGASIQMMKNIVRGQSDQSFANQEQYQRSARSLDRYTAGDGAKGSDPQGWARALGANGAGTDYQVIEARRFNAAVRAAARALRRTGKPVGLLVGHGSHAWVMTGFTATADPAIDNGFRVTSVYIMGSLWPRDPHHGFDPRPNTRIGMERLRERFFTRYRDRLGPSPWDGSFVIIRP